MAGHEDTDGYNSKKYDKKYQIVLESFWPFGTILE